VSLEKRIAEIEALDPVVGAALRADAVVLAEYSKLPATARALELQAMTYELIEDFERRRFGASLTINDLRAAVAEHGGVRPAARALGMGHASISRRLRRLVRKSPVSPVHSESADDNVAVNEG
jgi:hypothetical protein